MEKRLGDEQLIAHRRLIQAQKDDPEWGKRAEAAWRRLTRPKQADLEDRLEFEKLLKEKGLLPEEPIQ